jgi:hypothetical protein
MFCLAGNAAEVRFDKKSRPYVVCRLCTSRAFIRDLSALRGIAFAQWLFEAAVAPAYLEKFNEQYRALVAEAQAARPTEKESGLPPLPIQPFMERKAS